MGSSEIAGYDHLQDGDRDVAPRDGAAQVPASSAPELKSLLGIAVGTLVITALYFGKDILIPITLAVILSFVLSPIVNFLQRLRLWRAPAVIVAVLAALALLGLIGTVIGSQAASLSVNAPQYAETIQQKVSGVQTFAVEKLGAITKQFGGGTKTGAPPNATAPGLAAESTGTGSRQPVPVEVVEGSTSPFTIARTVLEPILAPIETTVLVFIVAIFILMQKEDLLDRFIRVFGSNDLHRTTRAMDDAGKRLSKYFLSQLAVNTCFGIVIGLGLWAIGVPASAMWGLLAGLLRFVPYIGPLLAAVAPAALAAAVDPSWTMAIEVVALFFLVEPLTGYVVEPLLYGHSTGLSPISVIVAAIFWTWVWGPIGLIISTPLTLCLVVLGRHVKSLEFFDVLLGDRPALTPIETFYQRILADNPDEALAQAELMLSDRSLVSYYDEVLVPGVKLAVEDQARATIDRVKAKEMTGAMLAVIDDLKAYADPAPDDGVQEIDLDGIAVASVAGRGPFDLVIATMLSQVLERAGAAVRTIGDAKLVRQAATTLNLTDVDVIVISYVEAALQPAEIRYLIKRLRERAPWARIVVTLWSLDNAATDPDVCRTMGADVYCPTLREALEAAKTSPDPLAAVA